jgi:nucleoid DNA-binding protein
MIKKQEIMSKVAAEANVGSDVAGMVVEKFFEVLIGYLTAGEAYNVPRFGTFKPVQRAARVGRNPLTKERVAIAPQVSIKLVVSDQLKAKLNPDKS